METLFYKKDYNTFIITHQGKDYFFKPDEYSMQTMDMTEYHCREHGKFITMNYYWRSQSWEVLYTRKRFETAEEALLDYFKTFRE